MASLMYGPDDIHVTRSDIAALPRPRPMGPRHNPVPFIDYIDDVSEALDMNDLQIAGEDYIVTSDKMTFFGLMEIVSRQLPETTGWRVNVGLRGSVNQTLARGLVLGSSVIVCSNLCFHGNIASFKTKQTTNVSQRIGGLIRESIGHIPEMVAAQEARFTKYRETEWKPRWGDAALVDMYRKGAFSSPQLTRAIDEWHEPSFDHGDWSLWRLFNAGTEALKPGGANVNMALVEGRSRTIEQHVAQLARAA